MYHLKSEMQFYSRESKTESAVPREVSIGMNSRHLFITVRFYSLTHFLISNPKTLTFAFISSQSCYVIPQISLCVKHNSLWQLLSYRFCFLSWDYR